MSSTNRGGDRGAEASRFITGWIAQHGPAPRQRLRALDLAMGGGRHAILLGRAGYDTFGVDIDLDALRDARRAAAAAAIALRAWRADLTEYPLPARSFDLLVVVRYLQRDLFGSLREAMRPGGVVLYETFTTAQRLLGWGPRSADHLLEPGELMQRFDGFDVLFYEEVSAPEAVARIAARAPG
jgi:SAM-dependent methyltransferase